MKRRNQIRELYALEDETPLQSRARELFEGPAETARFFSSIETPSIGETPAPSQELSFTLVGVSRGVSS